MTTFVLTIMLMLPSFGGPVTINVETATLEGCLKFRSAVVKQFAELLIPEKGLGECTRVVREG